jgi:hypothetical protein
MAAGLTRASDCKRIEFETSRVAPTLLYGLDALGLPMVFIKSQQVNQPMKTLVQHKAVISVTRADKARVLPGL